MIIDNDDLLKWTVYTLITSAYMYDGHIYSICTNYARLYMQVYI